jgi:hypothetical protein
MGDLRKVVSSVWYVLPVPPPPEAVWSVYNLIDSSLIHVKLLGTHMIVVNSAKAAYELFEKRSAIYSDRVQNIQ